MKLSNQAIEELKLILAKEAGEGIPVFTHEELNEVGVFLLTALAERLKMEKHISGKI